MKLIPLSKGKYAKVDDAWFDYLSKWKWHFDGKYARRNIRVNGKLTHIYMHKVVAGIDGMADHRDLDTLNNQSSNLRPATKQQNAVNTWKQANRSSIYKGVSKCGNGWRTQIWYNNNRFYDAFFLDERYAAMAHDLNAITHANQELKSNKKQQTVSLP